MRKAISFICAIGLLFVSSYAVYFLLFEAVSFKFWMPAVAAMFIFVSLYWLWEDFIRPALDKNTIARN